MIPVVIGISIIIFFIMSLSPGDPARLILGERASAEDCAQLRHEMGLDKPLPVQYLNYISNVLKGDFGISYRTKRHVMDEFLIKFPVTIKLSIYSILIAVVVGIPIGIISAVKQYSVFDKISTLIALIGTSIPPFWLGLMLILLFSLHFRLLPANGIEGFKSYILPSITLSSVTLTYLVRVTRSSLLEVIREDYIRTARSKGAKENSIIIKHALNNALIPVITTAGVQFGYMLGGSVITETVFAIPGLGRFLITGIRNGETAIVMGSCLLLAVSFSVVNLVVDILYAFLDPRIKAQYSRG